MYQTMCQADEIKGKGWEKTGDWILLIILDVYRKFHFYIFQILKLEKINWDDELNE